MGGRNLWVRWRSPLWKYLVGREEMNMCNRTRVVCMRYVRTVKLLVNLLQFVFEENGGLTSLAD